MSSSDAVSPDGCCSDMLANTATCMNDDNSNTSHNDHDDDNNSNTSHSDHDDDDNSNTRHNDHDDDHGNDK